MFTLVIIRGITKGMKPENKANNLWKERCVEKWGEHCNCYCGAQAISVHHFIAKSRSNHLRYDVKNGVPICRACHWTLHSSPDTLKRRALEDTVIKARGPIWLAYIEEGSRKLINKNKGWLKGQIERLENNCQ